MLIVILLVPQRAGAVDGLPATLRSVSLLRLSARATSSAGAPTLSSFVNKVTRDKVELVATDENQAYNHVRRELPHQAVNHTQDEWVRGEVHANNIESFWSLLERGVVGRRHVLYVAEHFHSRPSRIQPQHLR